MTDDWILTVLADLRSFAEVNGLPFLAGRLADTQRLAEIELALRSRGREPLTGSDPRLAAAWWERSGKDGFDS